MSCCDKNCGTCKAGCGCGCGCTSCKRNEPILENETVAMELQSDSRTTSCFTVVAVPLEEQVFQGYRPSTFSSPPF